MIFPPHHCDLIRKGHKKRTWRRLIGDVWLQTKDGEIVAVHKNGLIKYKPGRIYGVQPGRGKKSVCHIKLVAIESQRPSDLSGPELHWEGFCSDDASFRFIECLANLYKTDPVSVLQWPPGLSLGFDLVEDET